ncbi:cation transport ATPase, E1-E2 family protein [Beggiatoa sp. PS]|nr:cation transport ATPase, E1-E2 family protein [Beggiatoa sp. PS]
MMRQFWPKHKYPLRWVVVTQIARASADMILLTEQLPHLLIGINTATQTLKIIRQNIVWAISYNAIALPAAAIGWIAPWIAAIGMSFSSLLVVANALRLTAKTAKTNN